MLPWIVAAMMSQPANQTLYVGTYTDPQGSKGIYRLTLDTTTGALSEPMLAAEATGPSYLAINSTGKYLYCVNEALNGEATAFQIRENGNLEKLNSVSFDGKGACHISMSQDGKHAFIAAYGGGTLSALSIQADGRLSPDSDTFRHSGSGPNKKRQSASHMHFSQSVGKWLYACDLGSDEVLQLRQNASTGDIEKIGSGRTPPGAGPRHFVPSRDGKFLYVNNEMGMSVSVFEIASDGALILRHTVPTLADSVPQESWSTAAIKMHPRLPILYVSNRGHNSITTFEMKTDGNLRAVQGTALAVVEPRDFAIDSSGEWIVVGGQKSNAVQTLSLDPISGIPKDSGHRAKIFKPVCLVFRP